MERKTWQVLFNNRANEMQGGNCQMHIGRREGNCREDDNKHVRVTDHNIQDAQLDRFYSTLRGIR